jgi:hypothetical protein
VALAAAAIASLTTFTTNSPVSSTLRSVSLRRSKIGWLSKAACAGVRTTGQNSTVGGLEPTPVKKLKGARLGTPLRSRVETSATGRGTMMPVMSL